VNVYNTMTTNKEVDYSTNINDKNVLIIDDSITKGQSIHNAIKAISNTYHPHSISILTMFSQLYDSNGNYEEFDINRHTKS
jgi:pyrimidine operon attenuation protein/uracil phosphoribosyltransferase